MLVHGCNKIKMRTIEEVLAGRDMTADEFRVISHFWSQIREIQGRRDAGATKNRYLVGVALGTRRLNQQEIDIETLVSLTGLGRSSLQKTLKTMVDDKMVRLETDPNDRRRTFVKPTEAFTNQSIDMYEETRNIVKRTAGELDALVKKK